MDRRRFLSRLAASAVAAAASPGAAACGAARPRRVLCYTKASGWEHDVVRPGPGGAPSVVDRAVQGLAARGGFEAVCTKDGSLFTPQGLRDFDGFFFYTTGDLTRAGTDGRTPMPPDGKRALLEAVRAGKGFVGVHSASDTFHAPPGGAPDPYLEMLGGEFIAHGEPQTARVRVVDPGFPGMAGFGEGRTERHGEWYSLAGLAPDMHVLMVLETDGMTGPEYERGPYPVAWARRHGRGRVYYSALGHFAEEWSDPAFLGSLEGAIRWALGDAPADTTPNLAAAAPRHGESAPPR